MCGQTSDKQKRYATKWSMLIITIMEQVALMRIVCCDLLRWRTLGQDEKEFQVFFAGSKTAYTFRWGQRGMIERLQVLDSMFGKENVIQYTLRANIKA